MLVAHTTHNSNMLFIHGIGHFHPENQIDNHLLESLDIGTTEQWILDHTGIHIRNTVLPLSYIVENRNIDPRVADEVSLYTNAETGYRAATMALGRAGLSCSEIGMVIAGGSAPRMTAPAESCIIADRLGISAPALDINSACSTFAIQLRMLTLMNADSLPDFVLVINPENVTRTVNYNDRSVAVLMGDCSTAAVVSKRVPARTVVKATYHQSDPLGWSKVTIPTAGHLFQDGSAVQNFAIRKTVSTFVYLREQASSVPYFIGPQANFLSLRSICARAGVTSEQHLFNVDRRGNCGAAGGPSVLSEKWDQIHPGDEVVMAFVGAGLTWAGLLIAFT
jgi:3-oxoacyl-[acyl-carrier-protein] synthase-3